jgi:hypothetical protein
MLSEDVRKMSKPAAEQAAAASARALADRKELALVAVERTRMPMVVTDPRQTTIRSCSPTNPSSISAAIRRPK